MKKKMSEFLNEEVGYKRPNDINPDRLNQIFYFISDIIGYKEMKYMEFLQSLDLTEEQYLKLASLIEDYGFQKYEDGSDGPLYNEPCEY